MGHLYYQEACATGCLDLAREQQRLRKTLSCVARVFEDKEIKRETKTHGDVCSCF